MLKLDGEHTAVTSRHAGPCRRRRSACPRWRRSCAREGLTGFEFGVNIPGTIGGAVRMNAGAYGGELAGVLRFAEIASADGLARRDPRVVAMRLPQLGADATARSSPARRSELRREAPQTRPGRIAAMRSQRHAAQPQGIRTFGSTFKQPRRRARRGVRLGCCCRSRLQRAHGRRRAFLSQARELHREHGVRRTADVLAVMDARPPAGDREVRRRARAGGPDARGGSFPMEFRVGSGCGG